MSILEKLKDATIPSVFSAGAAVGLFYVFVDKNLSIDIPFANTNLPLWAAIGGASFIGAELGQLGTEFLGPKIPMMEKFEGVEKAVIPPVMSGLATYLSIRTLISENTDFMRAFLIGSGGDILGKYAYAGIYNKV